ncbi:hypothetical protein [Kitasatospora sp. NPDC004272]
MRTIRWDEGDPRRLFPALDDPSALLPPLRAAAGTLRDFAERFGGDWQLSWHELPAGPCGLSGYAEGPGLWCEAELDAPRDPLEWHPLPGPPWELSVRTAVRCAAPVDCGSHRVHELPERAFDDPVAAVTALAEGVRWAVERALAAPPDSWARHARRC